MIRIKSNIYLNDIQYVYIDKTNVNKHILYGNNDEFINRKNFINFNIKCDCGNERIIKKLTETIIIKKWECKSCSVSGKKNPMFNKTHTEEVKNKLSLLNKGENNPMYGINYYNILVEKQGVEKANEIWGKKYNKLSINMCGKNNPMYNKNVYNILINKYGYEKANEIWKEKYDKHSLNMMGEYNPMYNKNHTNETRKKISESLKKSEKFKNLINSKEYRDKMSNIMKGRIFSDEHKKNLRLTYLKKLEERIDKNEQIIPNFNSEACDYFDKIMNENNTLIQHARNGGEYYIKELGYFVDGYDKENNIVYEYDEKRHFDLNDNLKEKDIKRQKEIEEFLKCKFIRIKYNNK